MASDDLDCDYYFHGFNIKYVFPMSVEYQSILWNANKKQYDKILWLFILSMLVLFAAAQLIIHPNTSIETLIIRSTAFVAFTLLHIVLIIGPLCRISDRFLPLLYNRRHLGVSMFLIALIHGAFCMIQFHALGDLNPIESVFLSNKNYQSISQFPFQILGFIALMILLFMAATSHDFWLKNLSPKIWKSLHMLVYLAYTLIVLHVLTGSLQYESHPIYMILLLAGFFMIVGLHLYAGIMENKKLKGIKKSLANDNFMLVCTYDEIEESKARVVFAGNENIAIFKHEGKIFAVHNVCKHQMGPLGEGKIIDGCITCPWHGYQYLPHNGQSPPPFTEKVKTYEVKIVSNEIWLNPDPYPEGTEQKPAIVIKA